MKTALLCVASILLVPHSAWAQHVHGSSPYTDFMSREIKAISAEQMEEYFSGKGMGLALAAELNGYPGPLHVLEHSAVLGLDARQLEAVTALRDSMQREAIAIGQSIVEQERALDSAFRGGSIDTTRLARLTSEIGRLQGSLRDVHLRAHLVVKELLSTEQVEHYQRLRGYVQ
jgi:hypothetical protein